MAQINHYNGIVNVYKEKGFTSFDVVAKLRGICGQKKIGHTGTLDPDAEGVLPVCLGNGTKMVELLTDHDKEYVAELLLGIATDTQDVTGAVIAGPFEGDFPQESQIRSVIAQFVGEIMQVPPMYSALKVNGQKLCDLARRGIAVERQARPITVHEIEIISIQLPVVKMRVHCSKGTYIRTLCNDIGEALGCYGTMQSLVRTRVGCFGLENAHRLQELQARKDAGTLSEVVASVEELFTAYARICVTPKGERLLENGNVLTPDCFSDWKEPDTTGQDETASKNGAAPIRYRVCRANGTFAGLYLYHHSEKLLRPEKMFL